MSGAACFLASPARLVVAYRDRRVHHSVDCYAVPVLYPFTQRGFDGIAWTTPWFMVTKYVALATVGVWLLVIRKSR